MITLSNFCRIGKGVLTRSIGLQKNYKETFKTGVEKLDESQSGCFNCPIYKMKQELLLLNLPDEAAKIEEMCHSCSTAVWQQQYTIQYINEKNRYGYQPRLKSNAIKLLLCYHFLQPDANGLIKDVNLKDLAQLINCDIKTIQNNNAILSEYGYCYFSNSGWYDNHINVLLPEYKKYHLSANEGGRGYMTFSKEMFEELLNVTDLNQTRLIIKGLLETDNQSISGKAPQIKVSYAHLRGFLPGYCKRGIIQQALGKLNNTILHTHADTDFVEFSLLPEYNGKELRKQLQEENYLEMENYIHSLNDLFDSAKNSAPLDKENIDIALGTLNITPSDTYKSIILHNQDYQDLASLCVQYSPAAIKHAISSIYNSHINYNGKHDAIRNFGGLIRSTVEKQLIYSSLIAS